MIGFETTFSGNLGTGLETKELGDKTVYTVRIAVRQKGGEDAQTVWVTGQIPERMVPYVSKLEKGNRVWCTGSLKVTTKGDKSYYDVFLNNIDAMVQAAPVPF